MRALTKYERERVEQLLTNWVESKVGASGRNTVVSPIYANRVQGRGTNYVTHYPLIQVDADRVNAVVYGRAASQFLPARKAMSDEYRVPLVMCYLGQLSQIAIASRLQLAQQTIADRLAHARLLIWEGFCS